MERRHSCRFFWGTTSPGGLGPRLSRAVLALSWGLPYDVAWDRNIIQIDRGYEQLEKKLAPLGAKIKRCNMVDGCEIVL